MSGSFNNFAVTVITPSQQEAAAGLAGNAFMSVVSLAIDPDPITPTTGEWYAIEAGALHGWAGHDGTVTCWDGTQWVFYPDIVGLIIYPQNVGSAYYISAGGEWIPWLPAGITPAKFSLNGSPGGSSFPSPADHSHPNYATAAGDAFGDPTLAWQFRLGAITGNLVKLTSGNTFTMGLGVNSDTTTMIWVTATGGSCIWNLPAALEKRIVIATLVIAGANTLTMNPAGTDTVNNAAAPLVLGIAANSTTRILTCDGAGAWSFI